MIPQALQDSVRQLHSDQLSSNFRQQHCAFGRSTTAAYQKRVGFIRERSLRRFSIRHLLHEAESLLPIPCCRFLGRLRVVLAFEQQLLGAPLHLPRRCCDDSGRERTSERENGANNIAEQENSANILAAVAEWGTRALAAGAEIPSSTGVWPDDQLT